MSKMSEQDRKEIIEALRSIRALEKRLLKLLK